MEGIQRKNISKPDGERKYRELDKRHQRFLKRYDQIMQERQSYKTEVYHLQAVP